VKDPLEESTVEMTRGGATRFLVAFLAALVALAVFVPGSRIPLAIIVGIVIMVMLHEAGHYITAKRAGMKVTEFFLGFGPRLWSFQRGETEYGVKALPLGGYVRIIGMSSLEEVDPEDEPRTYRQGRYRDRLKVVLAGVTVNLIIAFLLFFVVIAGRGVAEGPSTTINSVVAKSAAAQAGLQKGDRIVAVDGQPVKGWDPLKAAIEANGGNPIVLTVDRKGRQVEVEATPKVDNGQGFLGVSPTTAFRDVGLLAAVPESFNFMGKLTTGTADALGKLFSPSGVAEYSKNFTSDAPKAGSQADQNRPRSLVGIVDQGSDLVGNDLWTLLLLLGNISLILAVFNLLPVPPILDGGHAAIVVYEWAASKIKHRRVEVDYRKVLPIGVAFFAILMTIALSAMFLDVRQVIGGQ
jgi:membrane-associated protease RseP (regulator of RpoE activity)